jgi:XTP/dITP diphosphohydrolase
VKLLIATRSTHKVAEIRAILAHVPDLDLLDLDQAGIAPAPAEDDLEPYATFEANARSKASYFRRVSGLRTVADDSGLEVDALNGEPGVRSRRFAPLPLSTPREVQDKANNDQLLERLAGLEDKRRTARYVCVAALSENEGRMMLFRGTAEGRILTAPRGTGGFGYDPLFLSDDLGTSFGEASPARKDSLSHRGKAFRALAAHLTRP